MNKTLLSRKYLTRHKPSDGDVNKKDRWDILASLTPLILGLAVTGVGGVFTHLYNQRQLESNQFQNERQLQLNQIQALDKLRPLLTSTNPQDREFAYSSFVLLGYEKIVLKMISSSQDASGKSVAQELLQSPDETVRQSAEETLKVLSKADILVNTFETGDPNDAGALGSKRAEALELADGFGVKTELGKAVIQDTLTFMGGGNVRAFASSADTVLSASLKDGAPEKEWLLAFIKARRAKTITIPVFAKNKFVHARIDKLMALVEKEDWDLKSIQSPS